MKLRQVKLTYSNTWITCFENRAETISVCKGEVRAIFDVPCEVDVIWLTAHDRPSKGRVMIRPALRMDHERIRVEGHGTIEIYRRTRKTLRALMGKRDKVYVECEYLEGGVVE